MVSDFFLTDYVNAKEHERRRRELREREEAKMWEREEAKMWERWERIMLIKILESL